MTERHESEIDGLAWVLKAERSVTKLLSSRNNKKHWKINGKM